MEIPKEKEIEILEGIKKYLSPKRTRNFMCEIMRQKLRVDYPTKLRILKNLKKQITHEDTLDYYSLGIAEVYRTPASYITTNKAWFLAEEVQGRRNLINRRLRELRK